MDEERKYFLFLSVIVSILSGLLLIKFLPNVLYWNVSASTFLFDILGLIWPFLGFFTVLEFLSRDKTGFGGILFHIFVLYCAIYYSINILVSMFSFSVDFKFMFSFCLNLCIMVIGWFGFLIYYD